MTKIFKIIGDFLASDFYLYSFCGCLFIFIGAVILFKIIGYFINRRKHKEFLRLCKKYGIDSEYKAPDYVWSHIDCLMNLAEVYELDTLYNAQDKFNEIYALWQKPKDFDENNES